MISPPLSIRPKGGQSTYEFNADDFSDPYPEEVIQAELAKRGPNGELSYTSSFFNPEEDADENNTAFNTSS